MTTRREILIGAASLALVPACGTSNMTTDTGPAGPTCVSQIQGNHPTPHVLRVPPADLSTGTDHTYNIQGMADHSHDVVLTATDLTMLGTGATVSVTSSLTAGHTHACMVHCTS